MKLGKVLEHAEYAGRKSAQASAGLRVWDPTPSSGKLRVTPPSSQTTSAPPNSHKRRRPPSLQASPTDFGGDGRHTADPSGPSSMAAAPKRGVDTPFRRAAAVLVQGHDEVRQGSLSLDAVVEDGSIKNQGDSRRDGAVPETATVFASGSVVPGSAGPGSAVSGSPMSGPTVKGSAGDPSVVVRIEEPASSVPSASVQFAH
ncbi:hypothetical protein PIB30_044494 [Stylosanthes scabra]|uniref:Uncharacterized protein n=1 Tax=Stylosanthes scabra TaxID=79078 RepID=A0ABU6XER8_9FABA|nr:hypothetical protein [Stylosanthes scabra]